MQDFFDLRAFAVLGGDALLVLARDHLTQQTEGEELEPDDREQDAEREQGPLSDRMAGRLQYRQVDEDSGPEGTEQETEAAEQVQRAVPVAPDEHDRKQVEEAAHVALEPV